MPQYDPTLEAFDTWYQADKVYACHKLESKLIIPIIEHFKPYSVLQLGNIMLGNLPKKAVIAGTKATEKHGPNCIIDYKKLPFQSEYFDVVICPHWHEIIASPTCLFSEISRILVPEGLLVLYSMNPIGIWSIADNLVTNDAVKWIKRRYTPEKLVAQAQVWQLEQAYHIYAGSRVFEPNSTDEHEKRVKHNNALLGVIHQTVLRKSILGATLIGEDLQSMAISGI